MSRQISLLPFSVQAEQQRRAQDPSAKRKQHATQTPLVLTEAKSFAYQVWARNAKTVTYVESLECKVFECFNMLAKAQEEIRVLKEKARLYDTFGEEFGKRWSEEQSHKEQSKEQK